MKKYMILTYSSFMARPNRHDFEAENIKEARLIAFQYMCKHAGTSCDNYELFELKDDVNYIHEANPYNTNYSRLDYNTGHYKRGVQHL